MKVRLAQRCDASNHPEYDCGTRVKTSVTLPSGLLEAIDKVEDNRSAFIEKAVLAYLSALDRQRREARDLQIINRNAKRLTREAEDVLGFQRCS